MERLTTRRLIDGKADAVDFDLEEIQMAYDKLCAYEDAEEQGRLLIMPCEIDDWLYAIIYDENFHIYDVSEHPIVDLCFSGTIVTDAPLGAPGCETWTPKEQEEYLVPKQS